jgi:hypothetical protein
MRDPAREFHGEIFLREGTNILGSGLPHEHISEVCHNN